MCFLVDAVGFMVLYVVVTKARKGGAPGKVSSSSSRSSRRRCTVIDLLFNKTSSSSSLGYYIERYIQRQATRRARVATYSPPLPNSIHMPLRSELYCRKYTTKLSG